MSNTDTNPNIKKTSQCGQGTLNAERVSGQGTLNAERVSGQDTLDTNKSFAIFSKRTIDFFMKKNNLDKHDTYVQGMMSGCEEYNQSGGERKRKRNTIESLRKGNESNESNGGDYMDIDMDVDMGT